MPESKPQKRTSRLLAPVFLLALLVPWYLYNQEIVDQTQQFAQQTIDIFKYGFGIAIWMALAWFVIRVVDVFFWEGFSKLTKNGRN